MKKAFISLLLTAAVILIINKALDLWAMRFEVPLKEPVFGKFEKTSEYNSDGVKTEIRRYEYGRIEKITRSGKITIVENFYPKGTKDKKVTEIIDKNNVIITALNTDNTHITAEIKRLGFGRRYIKIYALRTDGTVSDYEEVLEVINRNKIKITKKRDDDVNAFEIITKRRNEVKYENITIKPGGGLEKLVKIKKYYPEKGKMTVRIIHEDGTEEIKIKSLRSLLIML